MSSGIERLTRAFERRKSSGELAFLAYLPAGFPSLEASVELLLCLEAHGVDVIEVGIPFSDPVADGPTIQRAAAEALRRGATVAKSIEMLAKARERGLEIPVLFMTYWNPLLAFSPEAVVDAAAKARADAFLVVDLPPEEATAPRYGTKSFVDLCDDHGLGFIPLVAPTTSPARLHSVAAVSRGFTYCVSITGVTGAMGTEEWEERTRPVKETVCRLRQSSSTPVALGFGVSKPENVSAVGAMGADGFVVGSAIVNLVDSTAACRDSHNAIPKAKIEAAMKAVGEFCDSLSAARKCRVEVPKSLDLHNGVDRKALNVDDWLFGVYGGRYMPETLMCAHEQLTREFESCMKDVDFKKELEFFYRHYIGRPTPIYYAKRLSEHSGGAQIYFKREELAFTGAHKINNAIGQALLAKKLGKQRIIAETGAGQHGVATATACAVLGMKCVVYMGAVDIERQKLNVFRMKMLGAEVVSVKAGSQTLKDAVNEALRDWVTNVKDTHYIIGSAVGPHPFPAIVREFQSVIGKEARAQMLNEGRYADGNGPGRLPDEVIACVGGGSNAIGIFSGFMRDNDVKLVGIEAGGAEGPGKKGAKHAATISAGVKGVLHGAQTYLLQDDDGQISETHSISAGLDYPGSGPEHCALKDSGRAQYTWATDGEALDAVQVCCKFEGIIPALESAHAIAYAMKRAKELAKDRIILVNVSGRGDKDMHSIAKALNVEVD